jgi:16S rRNA (cytosine967-C5)-methyltransferase
VRLAAARAYLAFRRGEAFRENPPARIREAADRRLYVQLVRGMVRHKRLLEAELARLTERPPERQAPEAATLALLGLYQLRMLERVPPHAALNETVGLAGALGCARARGWVNAVLRRAQRETQQREAWLADQPLAVRTSHPDWMVERWRAHYGERATGRLCEANNLGGGMTLRVETRRITPRELLGRLADEGVEAAPHPLLPTALLTEHAGAVLRSRAFHDGLCYVQDVASQLLAAWVAPLVSGTVVDVCAAPGGKLTQFAGWGKPGARLVGGDLSAERLALVRQNFHRLRLAPVPLLRMDGRRLPFAPDSLDGVLLDAPCSATGMIRKYPELKWRKHAQDLAGYARLQRELLDGGARAVRPGGWLLYVTCSLEPEENGETVAALLAEQAGFRRAFGDLAPPRGLGEPAAAFFNRDGDFQVLPGADRMGLYAALLRKAD